MSGSLCDKLRSVKSCIAVVQFVLMFNFMRGQSDTLQVIILPDIDIQVERSRYKMEFMKEVDAVQLTTGKKTQVISPGSGGEDVSGCNARQLFSRVPGMMVWENDGSGLQMGVSTRGLSPNRSWEFNVRQNGSDIAPDVFGYPEAYYTPPMEAIERIELIKGAASLQFGPQFGGLMNYVLKDGSGNDRCFYEGRQTGGSFGLMNTYNAVGGQLKRLKYYGFIHHRRADGWRQNSMYQTTSGYVSARMNFSDRWSIGANITVSDYVAQQPGGLTDLQFQQDARGSSRSRNWFGVPFSSAQIHVQGKLSESTNLDFKTFVNVSDRNSVGFTAAQPIADTLVTATGLFNARQVDRDEYLSGGAEMRISHSYKLGKNEHFLLAGVRGYQCQTLRNQKGVGSTGSDYDLNITGDYAKSFEYNTYNTAAFVENVFRMGSFSVAPGIRWEGIITDAAGKNIQPTRLHRDVFLGGVGAQYALGRMIFYGNLSQSFRPVTFSELTPSATSDVMDPNLKDASGYSADIGWKGMACNGLRWDVSGFYLLYKNRIGNLLREGVNFRTNIGTSVSKGVELYVELDPMLCWNMAPRWGNVNLYVALTVQDCRYQSWQLTDITKPSTDVTGNRMENAPEQIHRAGIKYKWNKWDFDLRYSYTSSVFTDALNTEQPSSNAQVGKIAAYSVLDASMHYAFSPRWFAEIFVNNLSDVRYATRRSTGYPGPGLLPGMGRAVNVTLGLKI